MGIHSKSVNHLLHWPSWCLGVGYAVYWLELFLWPHPDGRTSYLALMLSAGLLVLFLSLTFSQILNYSRQIKSWSIPLSNIIPVLLVGLIMMAMLVIALYASSLPVHLIQEFDSLNYHLTIPKQHLILGNFQHLPWSTADLYLLPLDFALAPFSLATTYPNKIMYVVFYVGVLLMSGAIIWFLSSGKWLRVFWGVVAVMSCHVLTIGAGIAMLDIVTCYLFLAVLHSLFVEEYSLGALEGALLFFSKSFIPLQILCIAIGLLICLRIVQQGQWALAWGLNPDHMDSFRSFQLAWSSKMKQRFIFVFLLGAFVFAGPFFAKSFYYTGSPLFPFAVGYMKPLGLKSEVFWTEIQQKAQQCLSIKDQYGQGRSVIDFLQHLWILAVPEQGVNNRFDYPVGLIFLLILGPFIYLVIKQIKQKQVSVLFLIWFLFWLTWWFSSQQSRFLIIPLNLMIILTIAGLNNLTRTFQWVLTLAIFLELISLYRAHRDDMFKPIKAILRERDKNLVAISQPQNKTPLKLNYFDAAYANQAINVVGVDSVFIIKQEEKVAE